MKHLRLPILLLAAVALFSSPRSALATTLNPSQFNAALKTAIGSKTGAAAYNAAANLFKKTLADKTNKKNVVKYTTSILKALKKPVKSNLQGKSRSTLANALVNGYFTKLAYNPMDSKFSAALKKLVSGLPGTQKTEAIAKLITAPILSYNTKKGGSASDVNFLNSIVYTGLSLPPPPPVS